MDTDKHLADLSGNISEEEARIILGKIVGDSLRLEITSMLDKDGWRTDGHLTKGVTNDGENWGHLSMESTSYDKYPESAIGTVLLSFINYIESAEFKEALAKTLLEVEARTETEDEQHDALIEEG